VADDVGSTERFGARAPAYATHRPSYPAEAIDAALAGLGDPRELTIADIGAGTGISARLFADRGAAVLAIEPNAAMRAAAAEHPGVSWRAGIAERTGLRDAGADLVVACQAFHWFATPAAMREFARVARRRVAILQYERHERDAFTKAYGDIVRAYARDDTEARRRAALATFAAFPAARVTRSEFSSVQELGLEGMLGRAASSSYLPDAGTQSEALRRDLRSVFALYQRDGRVGIAMVTYVLVADLVDRS
jgi:SAM-dependent methyltransferase